MELFVYLKHLYRFKIWLLIGLVIGGLIGLGVAISTPDRYRAALTLYISRTTEQESNQYFTYEGFYAQQTAANHTDTILQLLSSSEIINRALEIADLNSQADSAQQAAASIIAKKESPQVIQLQVTQDTPQKATSLVKGLSQAITQRNVELNQKGDPELTIEQVESQPNLQTLTASPSIYAGIAAFLGLILAIICSSIWTYINHHRGHRSTH